VSKELEHITRVAMSMCIKAGDFQTALRVIDSLAQIVEDKVHGAKSSRTERQWRELSTQLYKVHTELLASESEGN